MFGAKVARVELGHFDYDGSSLKGVPAVTQAELGELTPLSEINALGTGLLSWSRVLVVNADHATVKSLLKLADAEPQFAAYLLTKLFFLQSELPSRTDGELALAAMRLRDGTLG